MLGLIWLAHSYWPNKEFRVGDVIKHRLNPKLRAIIVNDCKEGYFDIRFEDSNNTRGISADISKHWPLQEWEKE